MSSKPTIADMNVAYKNLIKHQAKAMSSIETMSELIRSKTDFNCYVVYQYGDGFCVHDEDNGISLSPLTDCLDVIRKKGFLTKEEYNKYRI